jgi:hypothetical protein
MRRGDSSLVWSAAVFAAFLQAGSRPVSSVSLRAVWKAAKTAALQEAGERFAMETIGAVTGGLEVD